MLYYMNEEELAGSPYRELPKEELDRLKQPGTPMPSDFRKKYMQNLPKKAEDDELDPAVPVG
jgi:hypothetical protein